MIGYINLGLIFILFVLVLKGGKTKEGPRGARGSDGMNGKDGKDGLGLEYYKDGVRARNKKGEVVIEYDKPLKK